MFTVVSDHDRVRHMLRQSNDMFNKRKARYVRDLQPLAGAITLAYRKGSRNEADPLSRRADFNGQASLPQFWDGGVLQN
jgi:uncharacterized protein (DUF934 family)